MKFRTIEKVKPSEKTYLYGVADKLKSATDPLGSYTGAPDDGEPIQDEDDL